MRKGEVCEERVRETKRRRQARRITYSKPLDAFAFCSFYQRHFLLFFNFPVRFSSFFHFRNPTFRIFTTSKMHARSRRSTRRQNSFRQIRKIVQWGVSVSSEWLLQVQLWSMCPRGGYLHISISFSLPLPILNLVCEEEEVLLEPAHFLSWMNPIVSCSLQDSPGRTSAHKTRM